MICVDVDLITPCLKDAVTGEMVDTEVIRIRRKSARQIEEMYNYEWTEEEV